MKYHLAILTPGWIDLILDGKKTIESRFTKVRCAPFGKVHEGDSVYLKESGGLVKGMFRVAGVETFGDLTQANILQIFVKYREQIFVMKFPEITLFPKSDTGCWTTYHPPFEWQVSKHATLIHISDPVRFVTPFPFPKRDPRAWVVLDTPLHSCEICKDPFLLEVYERPDGKLIHHSEHLCPSCYAEEVAVEDRIDFMAERFLDGDE